jgi:hypothetical protein
VSTGVVRSLIDSGSYPLRALVLAVLNFRVLLPTGLVNNVDCDDGKRRQG